MQHRPATPPLLASEVRAERKDEGTEAQQQLALSLLEGLLGAGHAISHPVVPHSARLPSGERGMSLILLRALHTFYQTHKGLDKLMGDVCKEGGFSCNVCNLTASTGLSLAESIARSTSDTLTHPSSSDMQRASSRTLGRARVSQTCSQRSSAKSKRSRRRTVRRAMCGSTCLLRARNCSPARTFQKERRAQRSSKATPRGMQRAKKTQTASLTVRSTPSTSCSSTVRQLI